MFDWSLCSTDWEVDSLYSSFRFLFSESFRLRFEWFPAEYTADTRVLIPGTPIPGFPFPRFLFPSSAIIPPPAQNPHRRSEGRPRHTDRLY